MLALIGALCLGASPFPLPAIDGKPLAVTPEQKSFRLPMRFEKVRAFYEEQLGTEKEVTFKLSGTPGHRALNLFSKRKGDTWTRASIKEGQLETVVEVTRVLVADAVDVNGTGTPLVQFVFQRSKEVEKAVESASDPLLR